MFDWEKILAQVAIVTSAPLPFFVALFVFSGLVWLLLNWRYQGVIAQRDGAISHKDAEIALLKGQRDDYKDKLNGASPDQAKARIDALEARLAAMEPRRLNFEQRSALIAHLTPPRGSNPRISVVSELGAESAQYAADFVNALQSAGGWEVSDGSLIMAGQRPKTGIAVRTPNPSQPTPATRTLMNALASAKIEFDMQQFRMKDGIEVELLICAFIRG